MLRRGLRGMNADPNKRHALKASSAPKKRSSPANVALLPLDPPRRCTSPIGPRHEAAHGLAAPTPSLQSRHFDNRSHSRHFQLQVAMVSVFKPPARSWLLASRGSLHDRHRAPSSLLCVCLACPYRLSHPSRRQRHRRAAGGAGPGPDGPRRQGDGAAGAEQEARVIPRARALPLAQLWHDGSPAAGDCVHLPHAAAALPHRPRLQPRVQRAGPAPVRGLPPRDTQPLPAG